MPGSTIGINIGADRAIRPVVAPTIDISAMTPSSGPGYGVAGVVGLADGGVPGRVYTFYSYSEAAAVIRSGVILSHIARIMRPHPDKPGAGMVKYVRPGAPTQATATASGVVFTAEDYGRHTNGISVQVAVGATTPWDVTIRKRSDAYARTYSVGTAIEVQSTATTPKVVFDHAAKQVLQYENAAIVARLDYPTEQVTLVQLCAFLNARAGWTARVKVGGDPSMPVCFMDNPVLASAPAILTTYTALPANQGMLIWLLRDRDPQVNAVESTLGTYSTLSVVAETYLSGAVGTANDAIVLSDWQAALAKLENEDIRGIFVGTTDATVHAAALAHCADLRRAVRGRWRKLYCGGPVNQAEDAAVTAAQALDGPALYCWNGTATRNPITGILEDLGGLGSAAQALGLRCGASPRISLTNKPVSAESLTVPSPSDATINKLLVAGVTPIAPDVNGRPVIVQGITTWQGGANVSMRKELGLDQQDAVASGIRQVLERFKGEPLDLMTGQLVRSALVDYFEEITYSPKNPNGFLTKGRVGGRDVPAWENLVVTGDGLETWNVSVGVHPVGETAYIPVNVKFSPATISL